MPPKADVSNASVELPSYEDSNQQEPYSDNEDYVEPTRSSIPRLPMKPNQDSENSANSPDASNTNDADSSVQEPPPKATSGTNAVVKPLPTPTAEPNSKPTSQPVTTTVPEKVPETASASKKSSKMEFLSQRKWWILGAVAMLLLLLLGIYWLSSKKSSSTPNWATGTRQIFPPNTIVTLRSKNSGKLLCFQDAKSALPNPAQEAKAGLVLEATGNSPQDKSCQWMVMDLIPSQQTELQGIAIRLRNIQYDTYIREIETTLSQNKTPYTDYTYQAGTGARLFSPLLAVQEPQGTIICGAVLFKSAGTKDLQVDNPFLLQSDGQGLLIAGPTVPVGNAPFWDVQSI